MSGVPQVEFVETGAHLNVVRPDRFESSADPAGGIKFRHFIFSLAKTNTTGKEKNNK
jgi:hypothetical protein